MTVQEVLCKLEDKYGEDFNWYLLPLNSDTFVKELKREIGADHFLYNRRVQAVAKCDSNDDILFVAEEQSGTNIYYIFHLTFSDNNLDGFPRCETFENLEMVKGFMERSFILNYV